ncbi:MAG: hypothetical protein LBJ88_02800 [Campylobacteraceae bacterium]|jgi:hypothetical protein|nr:hypothetical protein [Campylobacteraceae bacterium]
MKIRTTLSDLKLLLMSILCIVCIAGCGRGSSFNGGNSTTTSVNASTPIISVQIASAVYVQGDAAVPLELTASVNDGGVISYQWYSNTINSNDGGEIISGATSSSYVPPTSDIGTTYYYVVVTNTNNNAKEQKWASVVSDVARIDVNIPGPTYSVSFYDESLNLLAEHNMPLGYEVKLNSNKTAYNIDNWYFANSSSPVTYYALTNESVKFYGLPNVQEIADQSRLDAVRTNVIGKYILLNNIELDENGAGFDENGWLPIGNSSNKFTGIFNGNHHKITNLWISRASNNSIGLFGYAENVKISNLGVEVANGKEVKGWEDVGAIIGHIDRGVIINSYSVGNVGGNESVGGIAGRLEATTIANSYSTANVSGEKFVGGISGHALLSGITNSYSTGNINGTAYVSGISPYLEVSNVTNSYSTANVSGYSYVSGIVGQVDGRDLSDRVINNAAINLLSGKERSNRIVAMNINIDFAFNNFALNSTSIITPEYGDAGTSKTIEQLKTKGTYSEMAIGDGLGGLGWKFGNDDTAPWKIDSNKNNGYPYLYWQKL